MKPVNDSKVHLSDDCIFSRWRLLVLIGSASLAALLTVACKADDASGHMADYGPGLYAHIETGRGTIVLRLEHERVPLTVANFVGLAEGSIEFTGQEEGPYYDGLTFHRYVSGFVIQGGCPDGTGTGGPGWSIPGEFQNVELSQKMPKHRKGILAMARSQDPDSAGSQFYICLATASHLDGSYTSFGNVIEGIEVVDELRQDDVMETVRLEEE